MRFYTIEQIGNTRELTPEGFLLCRNVPIARTGEQVYAHGEIPVQADASGRIRIQRDAAEVFRPETIASANGKPIVNDHPDEGPVTPFTWRKKSIGVVLNPRQGDGLQFDNAFLYADLLITDEEGIKAIDEGKIQVSAGYDAGYDEIEPGRGRQKDIVINHVALVDAGRCGPRCAIGDSDMANRAKMLRARLRRGVRTSDMKTVDQVLTELEREPELMGEVISGDEEAIPSMSGGEEGGHHVTINVHGAKADGYGPEVGPTKVSGDEGGDPAETLSNGPDAAGNAMNARMDRLEQIVAMIAEAVGLNDNGGGDPDDDNMNGDRRVGDRRFRDRRGRARDQDFGSEARKDSEEDTSNVTDRAATGDRRGRTGDADTSRRAAVGDSTSLSSGFQLMLSQAELLMPGIALPTFDSSSPAKATFESMCSFKRKTLQASKGTDAGSKAIRAMVGDDLEKVNFFDSALTCDHVTSIFNGAASLIASERRGLAGQPKFAADGSANSFSKKVMTPVDLNAKNREFWAAHA